MTISSKAQKFLNKYPEFIGEVAGYKFYEHPTKGDESTLICINPSGQLKRSCFYELPTVEAVLY